MKIGNEYKLSYLYGETFDQINSYLDNLEETENDLALQVAPSYDSNLQTIYDYSKLEALSQTELNNIYDTNKNIAVMNYGLIDEDADEAIQFIKTINITENNI